MTSYDKLLLWWRHFGKQPASRCCAAALQGGQCRGQAPWLTPAQHSTARCSSWHCSVSGAGSLPPTVGSAGRDIQSRHVRSFITGLSFLKRLNRTNTFFLVQKCVLCTQYKTRGNTGGSDCKAASLSTVLLKKLPRILCFYKHKVTCLLYYYYGYYYCKEHTEPTNWWDNI